MGALGALHGALGLKLLVYTRIELGALRIELDGIEARARARWYRDSYSARS
jgi:hypothetical protein